MRKSFGFFNYDKPITSKHIAIYPNGSAQLDERITSALSSDGWVFAPPYGNRLFSLPHNYHIEGNFKSILHLRFVLWCISFVFGVRLSIGYNEFVDSTNININKTFDFIIINDCDIASILDFIFERYDGECKESLAIISIIHLLFLNKTKFKFQFERFQYLYSAFDSCCAILKKRKIITGRPHNKKFEEISEHTAIIPPKYSSEIVTIRNDLFHEGLFAGKPAGYALAKHNILFHMNNYISRLLFYILPIKDAAYLKIECENRCKIGIRLNRT